MTTLLQLSDPHFGTERPAVVEALRALSRQLAPDLLVLSGDITQRARASQFRAARAFVDSLGIDQVLAIPGNHDIPLFNLVLRLLAPYRNHRRAFGDDLEPVFDAPALLVVCVNTTRPLRHEDGEVSEEQVERVARRLAAARPEQLRVVVTHQPVAVSLPEDENNRLHGAHHAVRQWASAGADLVLGGHIHLPFVLPLHDALAGLPRRVWAVQAGTAVSSRIRHEADNSVNLIRYSASGSARRGVVERWDYLESRRVFELAGIDELEFDAG